MTPSWRECKLGDLLEIKHGFAFRGEYFGQSGTHIVLTPGNFFDSGGFKQIEGKEKWYSGPIPMDYVLAQGDLIVAMTEQAEGLLGSSAIVPENDRYLHNQRLGLVQVRDGQADKRFLYYLFNSKPVRQQIRASASGTKVRHTSPSRISEVKVSLPPLEEQRRIASILSAYDDLIENNLRRIKILEDMTRALYREWFVMCRFPGLNTKVLVETSLGKLPPNWKVCELQELAEVVDCLHSKKPSLSKEGFGLFLQLANIGDDGKLDLREKSFVDSDTYRLWTSRIELREGDCVITNVGRVGAVAQIPPGVRAAPGRNMTGVRPRPGRLTPTFLIEYLLSDHMISETRRKKDSGTIMDSLNVKGIIRLQIPCPPSELMERFERLARPMRCNIENLVAKNDLLAESRASLLPRLLSGQVPAEAAVAA